jgi:hypothetical protein
MEYFDNEIEEFINTKTQILQLEHSLISIAKWEAEWHKEFLSNNPKTIDETASYIKCMTITQNVDLNIYRRIPEEIISIVSGYIEAPMTATKFNEEIKGRGSKEIITSEIIYYWMIALNIPMEAQKWHLNRLLTLIRVCNAKNTTPKKMGRQEQISKQRDLNIARRKALNTKG